MQRNFPNSEGVYESDDVVVEVWRGLAETVSASCKIGDYVGINGRIHSRKYQKDEKVYLNYGFVAEKVDFLRWSTDKIHELSHIIRKDTYEEIKQSGFDIVENAKWLENFYIELYKKALGEE